MHSDLTPYRPGLTARLDERAMRRDLTRLQTQARGIAGQIDLEADLQAARVRGVAHVGRQALQATAMVSQVEAQLGLMVPSARGRLQAIGDMTAVGLGEVVLDTVRRLGR